MENVSTRTLNGDRLELIEVLTTVPVAFREMQIHAVPRLDRKNYFRM